MCPCSGSHGVTWERNKVPRATLLFCPSPVLLLYKQPLCFSQGTRVYLEAQPNSSYPSHALGQDCGWPHESLVVHLAWGHLALSTDRQVLGEQEEKDGNQQTVQGRDGGFICATQGPGTVRATLGRFLLAFPQGLGTPVMTVPAQQCDQSHWAMLWCLTVDP